jgi:hypothetical protein
MERIDRCPAGSRTCPGAPPRAELEIPIGLGLEDDAPAATDAPAGRGAIRWVEPLGWDGNGPPALGRRAAPARAGRAAPFHGWSARWPGRRSRGHAGPACPGAAGGRGRPTRLHRAAQRHPGRVHRDDRADRAHPAPRDGRGPDALQDHPGARQPRGQRADHPRRGGHGLERHRHRRLDPELRARPARLGHLRVRGRHHPHAARSRPGHRPGPGEDRDATGDQPSRLAGSPTNAATRASAGSG